VDSGGGRADRGRGRKEGRGCRRGWEACPYERRNAQHRGRFLATRTVDTPQHPHLRSVTLHHAYAYLLWNGILNPLNSALAFSWALSPRASVLKNMWKPWSRGYASRLAST
jgi:hypothetical protein